MERRTVIKQLAIITGASFILPSCFSPKNKLTLQLKKIVITGDEESVLAAMAETIIPTTNTPGAKEVAAHVFALSVVDDCYKKEEQDMFIAGLKEFQNKAKQQMGMPFNEGNTQQKLALLKELEKIAATKTPLSFFYTNFKNLTIQGYTESKYYLTTIQKYELVPGHFNGCVNVTSA